MTQRLIINRTGYRAFSWIIALLLFTSVEAFAQIGGVRVDSCQIVERAGPTFNLPLAPAPCPNNLDGLARSSTHYFYCTNSDSIYKIDLAGVTVGTGGFPGAIFHALAYVINADGAGTDMLYGLDVTTNLLIEFDPVAMTPTGVSIFVMPGFAANAISGGRSTLFVQTPTGAGMEIWRYETIPGIWTYHFLTPLGGTVVFDGISFIGGYHFGTVLIPGMGSDIWRYQYPAGWILLPGGPTLPFPISALGAYP